MTATMRTNLRHEAGSGRQIHVTHLELSREAHQVQTTGTISMVEHPVVIPLPGNQPPCRLLSSECHQEHPIYVKTPEPPCS